MSDLNIGQFINRFLNSELAKKFNVTAQGASNQGVSVRFEPKGTFEQPAIYTPVKSQGSSMFDNKPLNININSADKVIILKDLLNIPKDIKDFLLMMTNQTQTQVQDMQKLVNTLLASNVDISKILHFLHNNGKEANSKLLQMIASFNQSGANVNTDELKQLMSLINAFIPSSSAPQNQALKNLLILYLPWLPLSENTGFQLEVGDSDKEQSEKASEDSISILISTENFGRVKVLLYKESAENIEVQFSCSKSFPKDEVMDLLKKETGEYNLKMQIGFEENENLKLDETAKQEQQISMNAGNKVNSFLVLMAHFVVKTVLGVDKSYSLREKRKEMI